MRESRIGSGVGARLIFRVLREKAANGNIFVREKKAGTYFFWGGI